MAKTQTRKPAKGADKLSINETDEPARKGQRQLRRRATRAASVAAAKLAGAVGGAATAVSQPAAENAALSITSDEALEQPAVQPDPELQRASATAVSVRSSELPRATTKRAMLVGMLERAQGASVTEIGQRLGWLPHTVRAAITGLRHAGHEVTRSKDEKGQTFYRLTPGRDIRPVTAMSTRSNAVSREALARLPSLELGELRQQWRGLYKAAAPAHLSRELLMRAVAYRMQELALGGLRPEPQRRLQQIAREFNATGAARIGTRPALKPGTRLIREWQGRTYEVLVRDNGFSWQGSHYRSLSVIARTITGTPRSGPLFFGLKPNRSVTRLSAHTAVAAGAATEASDATG